MSLQSPRLSESRRSESPTTLSLFDTSGIDNTHSTAITDLEAADADADTAALAPNPATALPTPIVTFSSADPPCLPSTRPRLTREQTREVGTYLNRVTNPPSQLLPLPKGKSPPKRKTLLPWHLNTHTELKLIFFISLESRNLASPPRSR